MPGAYHVSSADREKCQTFLQVQCLQAIKLAGRSASTGAQISPLVGIHCKMPDPGRQGLPIASRAHGRNSAKLSLRATRARAQTSPPPPREREGEDSTASRGRAPSPRTVPNGTGVPNGTLRRRCVRPKRSHLAWSRARRGGGISSPRILPTASHAIARTYAPRQHGTPGPARSHTRGDPPLTCRVGGPHGPRSVRARASPRQRAAMAAGGLPGQRWRAQRHARARRQSVRNGSRPPRGRKRGGGLVCTSPLHNLAPPCRHSARIATRRFGCYSDRERGFPLVWPQCGVPVKFR